jgi:diadenosine tetraphosphate (Ap4A) HIT family hydrolase
MNQTHCELCEGDGGEILWQDERCRVVRIEDEDYPGFCRVVWASHVREMSDLSDIDRGHFMRVVFAVERALRDALAPFKINLASLGNVTPHLHWHVIPRFPDDRHFPNPIWASPEREPASHILPQNWKQVLLKAVAEKCDLLRDPRKGDSI